MVFDVSAGQVVTRDDVAVRDDMDFIGGIGRSFKIVAEYDVTDPFAPESPLVVNTGCLTGTAYMTGLRAYFTAYSPLKDQSDNVIGMLFVGKLQTSLFDTAEKSIRLTFIGSLILMVFSSIPNYFLARYIKENLDV